MQNQFLDVVRIAAEDGDRGGVAAVDRADTRPLNPLRFGSRTKRDRRRVAIRGDDQIGAGDGRIDESTGMPPEHADASRHASCGAGGGGGARRGGANQLISESVERLTDGGTPRCRAAESTSQPVTESTRRLGA